MKRCPITYEPTETPYSLRGLRMLAPQLKQLHPLSLNNNELHQTALHLVGQMALQGIQAKLSAKLKIKAGYFAIVVKDGNYILKPQHPYYPELPENEALTMSLATTLDFSVPVHGLVYAQDQRMVYFVKRFDRVGHQGKVQVETLAQLSNDEENSLEKAVELIHHYCTFPKIELIKLFKLTLFNFLIGNEDMHLKNLSLMTQDKKVSLSPVYDVLNSTIVQKTPSKEMALSLNGKTQGLNRKDFIDYFAKSYLNLNQTVIQNILNNFQQVFSGWETLIKNSFLSEELQQKYLILLQERRLKLDI